MAISSDPGEFFIYNLYERGSRAIIFELTTSLLFVIFIDYKHKSPILPL